MTSTQYLDWFDQVIKPTEPTFRRVPSEKLDFKLTESSFSIGQLLCHIPYSLEYITLVVRGGDLPFKSLREILLVNRRHPSWTVEQAVSALATNTASFKQAIADLGEEKFQTGTLETPQLGNVAYWRYAAFTLEHHIHHLMELHLSLRVLGVSVNTKSLYFG